MSNTVDLAANQEYRFELEPGESFSVTLADGIAECFGVELATGVAVPFGDEVRAAIWTPTGARLETRGTASIEYVATESVVRGHMAFHMALMQQRLAASKSSLSADDLVKAVAEGREVHDDESPPPNVMVVGGAGAGKTTLVKSLSNWHVRQARGTATTPTEDVGLTVVDLDQSQGSSTMPGSISAFTVKHPLTTASNVGKYGVPATTGLPVPFTKENDAQIKPNSAWFAPTIYPLVYYAGSLDMAENVELSELVLKELAGQVNKKLTRHEHLWKQGLLLDTPRAWVENRRNAPLVAKAARAFNVNLVAVLGSERLFVDMKRIFSVNKSVRVVRLPVPDGLASDDDSFLSRQRAHQIHSFFYGGPPFTQGVLSPFSIIVKFEDLRVVRVGEAAQFAAPDSALPIGSTRTVKDTEIVDVDLMGRTDSGAVELVNTVLGIVDAPDDASSDEIVSSPVIGFVALTALDAAKKKVTLLSQLPGRLPRKTLVAGGIEWQDI